MVVGVNTERANPPRLHPHLIFIQISECEQRIFAYTSSKDRIILSASLLTSLCAGATLPLMNILFARLVRTFSDLAATPQNNASQVFMTIINEYVLYIVYLFIGRMLFAYVGILGFRIVSLHISATIRLHYLQALFQQPISTLDAIPPGQITAIITITANILQLGISERLSLLIQATAVILVALVIGCIYSPELTLATASGLVIILGWYSFITPRLMRRYEKVQDLEREAASAATEALSGVRMISACCAEEKIVGNHNRLVERLENGGKRMSPLLALQHSPVFFTTFATFALCFWFAVKLYRRTSFGNIETLVVVLMSIMTMLAHLSAISVPWTLAANAINAASTFFTIIDAPKPITAGSQGESVSLDLDIVLENIHFAYPSRHDVRILQNLTMRLPAGKTTAIVGPSGSGKSTIVALILRWYELGSTDPVISYLRNGAIRIGNKDLNQIDLYWWRRHVGLVQQEPFLFNDTIFKNVEYGLVGTKWEYAPNEVKRKLVIRACKEAYADEFISALPEGYLTLVGDRGLHFSGGQRQRIAIARAIIRQPKILIFDEATSALDNASERVVQAALDRVAQGRTTIVIAHRLSTVIRADHIVVVANGKVVQQGVHSELFEDKQGAYRRLVKAQQLTIRTGTHDAGEHKEPRPPKREISFIENCSHETLIDSEVTVFDETKQLGLRPSPNKLRNIFTLLMHQKKNWIGYSITLIASIGAAVSSPLQAYLFGRLISSFAYPIEQLSNTSSFLCLMLLLLAIALGSCYFTLGWISNTISAHTVACYRKEYFENIITKRLSFFDYPNNSVGVLAARLATDPAQLQQLLGINMAMIVIAILSLVGCIIIAILFHWKFALVVIVSTLPVILAGGWYRVRHEVAFEAKNNLVFAESARFATEAIGAIRTVTSLTLETAICSTYEKLLKGHLQESWRKARLSCIAFAASDSLVLLCMAFALWYGSTLLVKGEILPFNFLVVYLAIIQGSLAAGQWLSFGPNFAQVSAAVDRIHSMRTSQSENEKLVAAGFKESQSWTLPVLQKGIEFRNVWFAYPTRNVPVLRGLSITIPKGKFVAIVGSSGSGKTTVISLLERFYEPNRGCIEYHGDNIASLPLKGLRKEMSLVAQEPYLFRGTIRENILLGVKLRNVDNGTLHQVCRDAGIHDFISSLPEGYETDVGTTGLALSGGQKQRLSICRALLRNPKVLLLDEATSSLDSESEKEIQGVLERTRRGRTIIVVAHRLSTVQRADIIMVMEQGRIVEQGTHQSLLSCRGVYWQMCQGQELS